MAGSDDTYCLITQPRQAINGRPVDFTLAITNTSSTTAYTISSVNAWATNTQGKPTLAARLTQPRFPPNSASAVAASSTLYADFGGVFDGSVVGGIPSTAPEGALLSVQVVYTDGSGISAPVFPVMVVDPLFGASSSPPVPSATVPSLQFINPANSGLTLLGWL